MRKIEPELIAGMGYIGDNPGVLYRMGGAGEQTVVTGNPALLEGVKGSRFTALALHGKSSQGSTTGAQLISLNDGYGVTTVNGVTKTPIGISAWKLEGISKEDAIIYPYSSLAFLDLSKGDYVFSVFGTSKAKARYTIIGRGSSGYIQTGYSQKISIQEDVKLTFNFMIENGVESNGILMIMLNSGSTSLPWEPYTGGAPSPSPSYPQEIESAGDDGEIGIEVGNNGYIQKGTYFLDVRPFLLKKGYTYHIKCEKITTNDINCFVMNEYNKNLKNSAELYDYGYTTKKLTIQNSTGIVDKECRMPMKYDGDGYTFTVKSEGLYLYQAVNDHTKNTDEFYVGYAPNILNEEYKKQTLIIPTPGGLPGTPVSSGGNYTDEKGQQWVCDEIDLANGEKVQWVYHRHYASDELLYKDNMNFNIHTYKSEDVNIIDDTKHILVNVGRYNPAFAQNNNYRGVTGGLRGRVDDIKSENDIKNVFPNGIDVWFIRKTPIRTPLPPETIAAYKALHTYSPTTTVINDAGAGMSVGYKRK